MVDSKLTLAKIGSALAISLCTAIFASLPFWSKKLRSSQFWTGLGNTLSSGIFFCTGIIHILPEAQALWNSNQSHDEEEEEAFPVINWISVMSFGLILLLNKVIFRHEHIHFDHLHINAHDSHSNKDHWKDNKDWNLNDKDFFNENNYDNHSNKNDWKDKKDWNLKDKDFFNENKDEEIDSIHWKNQVGISSNQLELKQNNEEYEDEEHFHHLKSLSEAIPWEEKWKAVNKTKDSSSNTPNSVELVKVGEFQVEAAQKHTKRDLVGPWVIITSVGLHAFFEGLSLGLTESLPNMFGILIAIIVHKWIESFAVGIMLSHQKLSRNAKIIYVLIFSIITPVGIGLGLGLNEVDSKVKSAFMAISVGIFIYLATCEIINEEFSHQKRAILAYKYIAFLLGCLIVVCFWFIEHSLFDNHDHGHDHEHEHEE